MFNYHLDVETIEHLALNAVRASLLSASARSQLEQQFVMGFAQLRVEHLEE